MSIEDDIRNENAPPPFKEGRVTMINSKKYHYVIGGRTLCGKFLYLGQSFEPDTVAPDKNDCAECRRRLVKRNEPRQASNPKADPAAVVGGSGPASCWTEGQ